MGDGADRGARYDISTTRKRRRNREARASHIITSNAPLHPDYDTKTDREGRGPNEGFFSTCCPHNSSTALPLQPSSGRARPHCPLARSLHLPVFTSLSTRRSPTARQPRSLRFANHQPVKHPDNATEREEQDHTARSPGAPGERRGPEAQSQPGRDLRPGQFGPLRQRQGHVWRLGWQTESTGVN